MKTWRSYALRGPVNEVVIEPATERFLLETSKECWGPRHPERAGFVNGLLIDHNFYIFAPQLLRCSGGAEIKIPMILHPYDEMETLAIGERVPNFRTVLFHSHPGLTEDSLHNLFPEQAESLISLFKREIELGIHDWINKDKTKISLDQVITESLTRGLGEEDISATPGDYHLLLTNTNSDPNSHAHINFWYLLDRHPTRTLPTRKMKVSDIRLLAPYLKELKEIGYQTNQKIFGYRGDEGFDFLSKQAQRMFLRLQEVDNEKAEFYEKLRTRDEHYQTLTLVPNQPLNIVKKRTEAA